MSRERFSRHVWLVEEMLFRLCHSHRVYELFLPTDVIIIDPELLEVRCSMAVFQSAVWKLVNVPSKRKRFAIDSKRRMK